MAFGSAFPSPNVRITCYGTYEAREEAFRERLGALVPRMHLGAGTFWQDINRIGFARVPADTAWITSNPADCLAFGTARQVLAGALAKAGMAGEPAPDGIRATALAFGLQTQLDQPVASLSGGETVKLALAKAHVAAAASRHLVIASPFSWLSGDNDALFVKLLDRYAGLGQQVEVFALDGEDCRKPMAGFGAAPLAFDLVTDRLSLTLGPSFVLSASPARVTVPPLRLNLDSPCLLTGSNGQGKSLMAKVICGAIPCRGQAAIRSGAGRGAARLLFQDVLHQGLMRSLGDIARSLGPQYSDRAWEIYTDLCATRDANPDLQSPATLLGLKQMLTAVRLAASPAALVLDEPDWGLSRSAALALVQRIIEVAHGLAVPVLMISHKPWWSLVAASQIRVSRTPLATDGRNAGFEIFLER